MEKKGAYAFLFPAVFLLLAVTSILLILKNLESKSSYGWRSKKHRNKAMEVFLRRLTYKRTITLSIPDLQIFLLP